MIHQLQKMKESIKKDGPILTIGKQFLEKVGFKVVSSNRIDNHPLFIGKPIELSASYQSLIYHFIIGQAAPHYVSYSNLYMQLKDIENGSEKISIEKSFDVSENSITKVQEFLKPFNEIKTNQNLVSKKGLYITNMILNKLQEKQFEYEVLELNTDKSPFHLDIKLANGKVRIKRTFSNTLDFFFKESNYVHSLFLPDKKGKLSLEQFSQNFDDILPLVQRFIDNDLLIRGENLLDFVQCLKEKDYLRNKKDIQIFLNQWLESSNLTESNQEILLVNNLLMGIFQWEEDWNDEVPFYSNIYLINNHLRIIHRFGFQESIIDFNYLHEIIPYLDNLAIECKKSGVLN